MAKKEKELAHKVIDDNQEKDITGGYYYSGGVIKDRRHEVLDDSTGEVVGRYKDKEQALLMSKEKGQCSEEINWATVKNLRNSKPR